MNESLTVMRYVANYLMRAKNFDSAKMLYSIGIQHNDVTAIYNMALLHQNTFNYDEAIKYYRIAIAKGDSDAMFNLAVLYEDSADYENMKIYYQMAIEDGDVEAMHNLGMHYKDQGEYEKMIEYLSMAIQRGNSSSMNNIGIYYKSINDFENMKMYYSMAIQNGNCHAMHNMALYYRNIDDIENMKKYHSMAIKKGFVKSMAAMGDFYKSICDFENMKKMYFILMKNVNEYENVRLKLEGHYLINLKDFSIIDFISFFGKQNNVAGIISFMNILETMLSNDADLPIGYYEKFYRLDKQYMSLNLQFKQYILKTTGLYPKCFNLDNPDNHLFHFFEMLKISSSTNCIFPKDIIFKIAGYLFR